MRPARLFVFIILITTAALFLDIPKEVRLGNFSFQRPPILFSFGRLKFFRDLELKLGLDLAGGSHLVFEANMWGVDKQDQLSALEAARTNIERRVNLFGVSEPLVQTSIVGDSYRVIVELPGIKEVSEAVDLIGKTAQLQFAELVEEEAPSGATPSARLEVSDLTGADLVRASVQFDPNTGKPVVALTFNDEGARKFEALTQKNVGRQLPILLDDLVISFPVVQEKISGGNAVITGDFNIEEARSLSAQLNAGALPVPIKLIEQRTVGATLGAQSIQESLRAGMVGLLAVFAFMTLYYGKLGFLASLGLVIYGILTLAVYKLIPVVLTLPGIAGFILSVGMAVDANILIFERMKEELRRGSAWQDAMEAGFGRAWDSIRDANVATLVTTFVLFNPLSWSFLHISGPVRGFAVTLALGILISIFTGVVVTRTVLRIFAR